MPRLSKDGTPLCGLGDLLVLRIFLRGLLFDFAARICV